MEILSSCMWFDVDQHLHQVLSTATINHHVDDVVVNVEICRLDQLFPAVQVLNRLKQSRPRRQKA